MSSYRIAEKFVSINGEGQLAGQLAVFIRFCGCDLSCVYCDTKWANAPDVPYEIMTEDEIYSYIKSQNVKNVTLTGGEPLIQPDIDILLQKLASDETLHVEIETNGSVDISPFADMRNRPSFTLDYKLPCSGMESHMLTDNYRYLCGSDTVKFVASSVSDLDRARAVIAEYALDKKCGVYLSAVFGMIEPAEIVDYMIKHKMNGINLQLQMHKFIWEPEKRGV